MDISAIALQGLEQAQVQLDAAATAIAGGGGSSSVSSNGQGADTVDLSTAVVALLSAKNQFALDIGVLKVADQAQKNLIDVVG